MFYLFLISLWPILNYVKVNLTKINNYEDVLIISGVAIVSTWGFGKLIQRFSREGIERYLLVFFVLTAAFFNYALFVDSLGWLAHTYMKASYVWLFVTGILGYGAWKISNSLEVQKTAKLLIVVMAAIPVLQAGYSYWTRTIPTVASDKSDDDLHFTFKHKPNVYYILVDAYARQDTLKEVANFDNEPFLHELERFGFVVGRNAFSNYHFTGASLPATMNMKYHQSTREGAIDYDTQMHESMKGSNNVRRIFKNNGYKIINIPAHWHQMTCYGFEDKCIAQSGWEVYQSFISPTPMRTIEFKNKYVACEDIKKAAKLFPGVPKFIFAHLAQVHDAIYDESGSYHSTLHPAFANAQEAQRYISSIKVINKELLALFQYVKENDKNAVIILQADHGPTYVGNLTPNDSSYWLAHIDNIRLKNKSDFRYTFGILSAVYFSPEIKRDEFIKNYFSNAPTLINTFRYLFAYLSEQEPEPLKDESHFLYYDHNAKVYREDDIRQFNN